MDTTTSENDIPNILNSISQNGSKINIEIIDKKYTYTKGNFNRKLLDEITDIIQKSLNDINENYSLHLKLQDIERIEELIDKHDNRQYIVSFIVFKENRHSISRLVLSFYKSSRNNIRINFLKSESDSLLGDNTKKELNPYHHLEINDSYNKTILKDLPNRDRVNLNRYHPVMPNFDTHIEENKKLAKLYEPCKYNLHEWDRHGINKQVKLHQKCSIENNSDVKPPIDPYYNPTMYGLNINLDIQPNTKL